MKYDTSELQRIGTDSYILSGQYINEAISDILSMNSFIKKAKCQNLIIESTLEFNRNSNQRCYLENNFLTSTGKKSKFPQILHFFTTDSGYDIVDNVFGDIFYFENGEIGKAKIVHWDKSNISVITLSIINGVLSLNKVEKTSMKTGAKKVTFKAAKSISN